MASGVIPHSLLVIARAEGQIQVVCFDSLMEWNLSRWGLPRRCLTVGWAGTSRGKQQLQLSATLNSKGKGGQHLWPNVMHGQLNVDFACSSGGCECREIGTTVLRALKQRSMLEELAITRSLNAWQ
jgi:hypothetical protein